MKSWVVKKGPERLVEFLKGHLKLESNKAIRKMLDSGLCKVNGSCERFSSRNLKTGDFVELFSLLLTQAREIETVYEDEDLLVIDKPSGLVCTDEGIRKLLGPNLFLVHRLDKGTTGLLILAKNHSAKLVLLDLFKERKMKKEYLALVDGTLLEKKGVRRSFLAKKKQIQNQTVWGSSSQGALAVTFFETVWTAADTTLVLVKPETGRTHQIRVHMAEMGHPVCTDPQYAKNYRSKIVGARPLLHAFRLEFEFRGKSISLEAKMPEDMALIERSLIG